MVEAEADWPLNQGIIDSGVPESVSAGYVFRDGSCVLCSEPPPVDWKAAVRMAEKVAHGSDYLRVDIFIKEGRPVLNEVTITCCHDWVSAGTGQGISAALARGLSVVCE